MRLTVGRVRRHVEPKGTRLSLLRAFRAPAGKGSLVGLLGGSTLLTIADPGLRIAALVLAAVAMFGLGLVLGPGPESTIGDKNVEVERLAEVAAALDGETIQEVAAALEADLLRKYGNVRGALALSEIE